MDKDLIKISLKLHRFIEGNRESFDETPNDILERCLGLSNASESGGSDAGSRKGWKYRDIFLPDGTELSMDYNDESYRGEIKNGKFLAEGKEYKSPSAAAGGVVFARESRHVNLNGRIYWWVKRPSDSDFIQLGEV